MDVDRDIRLDEERVQVGRAAIRAKTARCRSKDFSSIIDYR